MRRLLMVGGRREALTTAALGLIWMVGVVWLSLDSARHAFNDLRLAGSAKIAPGQVIDTDEDAEDADDGTLVWSHRVEYTFTLPSGHEIKSGSSGGGRLRDDWRNLKQPVPIEVEYDPRSPTINRLRGSGSHRVMEWFLRNVGLRGILLVLFLSPGVGLLRNGVAALRACSRASCDTPRGQA
jgi:hypothetical protein